MTPERFKELTESVNSISDVTYHYSTVQECLDEITRLTNTVERYREFLKKIELECDDNNKTARVALEEEK